MKKMKCSNTVPGEQGFRTTSTIISLLRLEIAMEEQDLRNVNNCLSDSIYFYLVTSGGQSSNL
jgi:hypothetical protein